MPEMTRTPSVPSENYSVFVVTSRPWARVRLHRPLILGPENGHKKTARGDLCGK